MAKQIKDNHGFRLEPQRGFTFLPGVGRIFGASAENRALRGSALTRSGPVASRRGCSAPLQSLAQLWCPLAATADPKSRFNIFTEFASSYKIEQNNRKGGEGMRAVYPSGITREQFPVTEYDLKPARKSAHPRKYDLYDIFCAILYVLKEGAACRTVSPSGASCTTITK
jgi:hypothetical protein